VRHDIGAFSRLEGVLFVNKLPKTRSGKILRRTIRQIINNEAFKNPPTIDDVTTLDRIKEVAVGKGYSEAVFLPNQKYKP